ncbi:MAG: ricin B lectin [Candidatus Gottesmanbacteria bacterium GW2011_GWA2_43_14]|uniref:Ricin B lectin n=1 Tax=Candidatus Gottesmanbacteria bacterium GW2011_GWA2_43_14 TaxID=1618443 RepID=A0A0G1G9U2_9BACT|nr:MAG: ricin B lectin [Candidatus Gottesmanbacteria bacterium GW2011_GWA2_43_14]
MLLKVVKWTLHFFIFSAIFIFFTSKVIYAQSIPGDANEDGKVDGLDYYIWLTNYNKTTNQAHKAGDFNNDTIVDGKDYLIWLNNYGISVTQTATIAPTNIITPTISLKATASPTTVPTSATADLISVDFASVTGPVTYRATGFIGNDLSNTLPSDSLILPLKPKLYSWLLGYQALTRSTQTGAKYQVKLWIDQTRDSTTIPSTINGDWSKWEKYVRDLATTAYSKNYTNVEFDIWNEPESSTYWNGSVDDRYFEMWRRAYNQIKGVSSNLQVAGPSSTKFSWTRDTFLQKAKSMNALPDVLTWHELNSGSSVSSNVANMRDYLKNNGYNITKISINEYASSTYAKKPGALVKFIYEFEKAQVYSASKACWEEDKNNSYYECAPHLDNLITYDDKKPRSGWWTYKSYADMTGSIVAVSSPGTIPAIASKDETARKGYILIGNISSGNSFKLVLNNLDKSGLFTTGSNVKILVQRIPNTESSVLTAPITVQQSTLTPQGNSLTINFSAVASYDAYFVSLSQ